MCVCVCAGEEEEVSTVGAILVAATIVLLLPSEFPSPFPTFAFGDTSVAPSLGLLRRDERGIR